MLTQDGVGAALVAGASASATDPQARVKALRAFVWPGGIVGVGDVLFMSPREARQLVGWGKAEILPPEGAEAAESEEG